VAERPTEVPEAEAGREVRSVAMWKPKKMSPTAFSKSGGYPRQIVTAKAMGDDWHGTGHMLLRAPAPKAGRVLERIADDKMVSAVEGQVKAATKLAEPVAVEKYGDRGGEGVWLKLADGGEVLVDSKLFGHAQRTFPKSDLTWFGSKSDGGIVAYIGKGLEKPGKHPVAVLMPMDAKGATLPTVIEGAGLTAPGKPVRGKKYMAYREPAAMSAETKADVAKQIQAAWERGKTSLTVKADGTSFKLADPNAMQRMHKTVTGKPVPGSEKAGFLLEPGGEPLPAMVTPEKLKTLGSVGPTTTALKPAGLKTVEERGGRSEEQAAHQLPGPRGDRRHEDRGRQEARARQGARVWSGTREVRGGRGQADRRGSSGSPEGRARRRDGRSAHLARPTRPGRDRPGRAGGPPGSHVAAQVLGPDGPGPGRRREGPEGPLAMGSVVLRHGAPPRAGRSPTSRSGRSTSSPRGPGG
jgi:hypothetical protein